MNDGYTYSEVIDLHAAGQPVDVYLSGRYRHSSLTEWREHIQLGRVLIDGVRVTTDALLDHGQVLEWRRPPWNEPGAPLTLPVLYQDDAVRVVHKPAGLPTLPGGGFLQHTLLHQLRLADPSASPMHRLGRWTSGAVLCARDPSAAAKIASQFSACTVTKRYRALATGRPALDCFEIDVAIGPVPYAPIGTLHAKRPDGRPALSQVRVLEQRRDAFLCDVTISTGRPHQIRIHMAAAGHPLVGDPLYMAGGLPAPDGTAVPGDGGYLLHAAELGFDHPTTGERVTVTASLPDGLRVSDLAERAEATARCTSHGAHAQSRDRRASALIPCDGPPTLMPSKRIVHMKHRIEQDAAAPHGHDGDTEEGTMPAQIETLHLNTVVANHTRDMTGRIAAVTGTTTGTGFICARELAKRGATVLLLNRASSRASSSLAQLRQAVPGATFQAIVCDLQDFASVRAAIATIKASHDRLDVLCNNAGVMALEDFATKDGYDVQIQTNCISHFLLTKELFPLLAKSDDARIVNHSSGARLGPPLEEKYFARQGGDLGGNGTAAQNASFSGPRWMRYHQTKLGNAAFTYGLKQRLEAAGITNVKSLLAHPGLAATNLQVTTAETGGMPLDLPIMQQAQSPEDGALGIMRACMDPAAASGDFFGPKTWSGFPELLPPEDLLLDAENIRINWQGCEAAVGEFSL